MPWFFWHLRSLSPERNALVDEAPWITYAARSWLGRFLKPHMRVFEWGSGGSTLYFAKRVASVRSIEHDPQWYARVAAALQRSGLTNCRHLLVTPGPIEDLKREIPSDRIYRSELPGAEALDFTEYCRSIDANDDRYDLILVDGRGRIGCFRHAVTHVAKGGAIMLDNSDRPRYKPIFKMMASYWRRLDFPGPIGYLEGIVGTTVWQYNGDPRGV